MCKLRTEGESNDSLVASHVFLHGKPSPWFNTFHPNREPQNSASKSLSDLGMCRQGAVLVHDVSDLRVTPFNYPDAIHGSTFIGSHCQLSRNEYHHLVTATCVAVVDIPTFSPTSVTVLIDHAETLYFRVQQTQAPKGKD